MEPIAETSEAAHELDVLVYDDDLLDQLRTSASRVLESVPECVGLSLTMLDHGVTLTLVATDAEIAALDAMQYLGGGPCIAAVEHGQVVASEPELLAERGWQLFASASAAYGIASTLSLPLLDDAGSVIGGVNLYAASPHGFDGHHEALAEVFGAWAGGAILNADLSFRTRNEARRAPENLRARTRLDTAVGLLAGHLNLSEDAARDRIQAAAASTGLPSSSIAHTLIDVFAPDENQTRK